MLIRFLKHSTGSGRHAIDYLLGEKDHKGQERAGVRVVRGDAYLIGDLIDSLDTIHRYSSGVIAFHPDDKPTDLDIEEVLSDFESVCFAGLDGDQYSWCAVEHLEDDGSKHIHIVVPRIELTTGKALNVAPPWHEYFFDKWRDGWNSEKGWRSPKDQAIARGFNKDEQPLPDWKYGNFEKAEIQSKLGELLKSGRLKNRAEIVKLLNSQGEVTRAGTDYISFKPMGAEKAIRLKGAFFAEDWTYAPNQEIKLLQPDIVAAKRYREKLKPQLEKRAAYNSKRYVKPDIKLVELEEFKEIDDADEAYSYPSDVVEAVERAEHVNKVAVDINQEVERVIIISGNKSVLDDAKRTIEETQRSIFNAEQRINESDRIIENVTQGISIFAETIRIGSRLISFIKKGVSKIFPKSGESEFDISILDNEVAASSKIIKEENEEEKKKEQQRIEAIKLIKLMTPEDQKERIVEALMESGEIGFRDASIRFDAAMSSGIPSEYEYYGNLILNSVIYEIKMAEVQSSYYYLNENKRNESNDKDSPSPN